MIRKKMGWAPELPSIKDWSFADSPWANDKPKGESPDRRALGLNPPIFNQTSLSSCVGVSSAYGVGFLRRTDQDEHSTDYSSLQLYHDARVKDGVKWKTIDSGAFIRDAMDCLRDIGAAPESCWPYKPKKFALTPPKSVYKAAARWKLGAHWRCDTLEHILVALDQGMAVVGGVTVYSSMSRAEDSRGLVPIPDPLRDKLEGGHALYFDCYSMADKLVRCENSWGTEWGDGGYNYFPMEYLANRDLSDDFWAMQSESPETTPWKPN